ncbi:cold shock domain-containing protein [Rhodococcus erythropolis]|uniref:cold shock domain-containing protein n=1 Tax=Rhodococcus erythropolis TaxID=1833 RepID=UPI001BEB812A|nr:cold-shock protein [Rhodococcus erythropolis]
MTTDTRISATGVSGAGDCSAANTKRGVVDWFNCEHGFGFIVPEEGGPSVFVHFSEIAGNGIYHTLQDGEVVTYEHDPSSHPPQARNVRISNAAGSGNDRHPNRVRPFRRPR